MKDLTFWTINLSVPILLTFAVVLWRRVGSKAGASTLIVGLSLICLSVITGLVFAFWPSAVSLEGKLRPALAMMLKFQDWLLFVGVVVSVAGFGFAVAQIPGNRRATQ
jgi:hypothetical protein